MTVLPELLRWVRPVAVATILLSSPAALSQTFFKDIEDLPIAPGLKEDADSGMRFDSPGGRIVTAVAAGGGSLDAYRRFYEKALPALGWKTASGGYQRDGEALLLEFVQRGGRIEVRVRIVPQGSEKGR